MDFRRQAPSKVQLRRPSRMETAGSCRRTGCDVASLLSYNVIILLIIFIDSLRGNVGGCRAGHGEWRRDTYGSKAQMEVYEACISRTCKHEVQASACVLLPMTGFTLDFCASWMVGQWGCVANIVKSFAVFRIQESQTKGYKPSTQTRNTRQCSFRKIEEKPFVSWYHVSYHSLHSSLWVRSHEQE